MSVYANLVDRGGLLAAADWAAQFPLHYHGEEIRPTMRRAWELAAQKRMRPVTLTSSSHEGAWRIRYGEHLEASHQYGFRVRSSSTGAGERDRLRQATVAEAFQGLADLECEVRRLANRLKNSIDSVAYYVHPIEQYAAELVSARKRLTEAVNIAYAWYGISYWGAGQAS